MSTSRVVLATAVTTVLAGAGIGGCKPGPPAPTSITYVAPSPTLTTAAHPSPSPNPKPVRKVVASRMVTIPAPQAAPKAPTCSVPRGISAHQVVLVVSQGIGATVSACTKSASGWRRDLGPYYGHVGYTGVIAANAKREGDGHTPAGVYALGGGFGLRAEPGLAQGWQSVHRNDVWVDDPGSKLYNTRQASPANGRWRSAESLNQPGVYDYAQVIAYNSARTPGRGSAIFLHVDSGGSTAGCVSVASNSLLAILRWERTGAVISIA